MAASAELTDAFEGFAHSLRINLEANFGARRLLSIDPHEAVGNMEQGLTQLLNAVASIYDATQKIPELKFDWYGTPETAVILSIRNARHHNHANRIRGLYNYHLQQPDPDRASRYVYVDYPETEDGGKAFDVPISWHDFSNLLALPQKVSHLRPSAISSMRSYLLADKLDTYATALNVNAEKVFFNLNPLIVNAGMQFVPLLQDFIAPRSMEGKWFAGHFSNVMPADTHTHVVKEIGLSLPD